MEKDTIKFQAINAIIIKNENNFYKNIMIASNTEIKVKMNSNEEIKEDDFVNELLKVE